ncbi:hypothetical protein Kfla_2948 [Kribbella flavida DSM 17836]|uniref:Uncharacterized protein n=1 Tax=Kribbella flavida (strain DSM 17836 / JCM 10339 / NBRC 14399) TaxID=479435 RepID=D2Q1M4_KRIFD|nr:hypothetical protein [Kribbella flavida]ADB32013.1 hypothetical protein Kfla_2948 [Kribbella flavida DSM 17836]
MTRPSAADLLALHAVRLKGMADDLAVADRFALDPAATNELLLDFQAFGWITWSEFAGTGGWSLTESGRAKNEQQLSSELSRTPGTAVVDEVYRDFLPLNDRLQQACTQWQLRPSPGDPLAANDHTDPAWDRRVIEELASLAQQLGLLSDRLCTALERFGGYDRRFAAALDRASAGDGRWVDGTGIDSCHTVWFELHEDLIATLNLTRGTEYPPNA